MKKLLLILPLVLLLCFTFSCQKTEDVAEEPAVDIAAEEAAIREAFTAWINANEAKDIDAMASLFIEDAVLVGGAELRDKSQMLEGWKNQFAKGNYWTSYPPVKIVISASGDMAYTVAKYDYTRVVEGETKTSNYSGILVWVKQADGSWKIVGI